MWRKKEILHTSRPQTIIQRFVPGETELRRAPTVQSDDTVFLTPGCQQSWQMQTVRSSCCHSLQMSAQIAEPTQPGANKLQVKLPSFLLPGLTGSKTHKQTIGPGQVLLSSEQKSSLNHTVIKGTSLQCSLHLHWTLSSHCLASA